MRKIIYTRADGGVSIVTPADKESVERILGPLTDAQYWAHVRLASIPNDAINPVEIEGDATFPDREFRNAWIQNDNLIDFDLEKARNIQLDRIRTARGPKLDELDKQFMLALEKGEDTKAVVQAKQELRDITEPLKALKPATIDDIKNAYPESLRGNHG